VVNDLYNYDIYQNAPVDLWWPDGHGDQTLYNLSIMFNDAHTDEEITATRQIGFRTVELVEERILGAIDGNLFTP